jgi:hypothetical protein
VVQVTSLTLTLSESLDVGELESEIVTALANRRRDEHGYELVTEAKTGSTGNP